MPAGRSLDLVNDFENARPYYDVVTDTITGWRKRSFHRFPDRGAGGGDAVGELAVLQRGRLPTPDELAEQPCRHHLGHLAQRKPPADLHRRRDRGGAARQAARVWQIAADGWLDAIWRDKLLPFKRDYFIYYSLRNIRIVLRVA